MLVGKQPRVSSANPLQLAKTYVFGLPPTGSSAAPPPQIAWEDRLPGGGHARLLHAGSATDVPLPLQLEERRLL